MSELRKTDFLIEVAKGNIPGHSLVHKFGRNSEVPNATFEGINQLSALFNFLTAPTTVRVKAGNVNDDSGGSGAREITVQGLDSTGALASETIATNGVSVSANTTTSFWRVFRMFVSASGTYGAGNTGQVIVENSAGTIDLISLAAEESQSQYGAYAIPLGKTGYLLSVLVMADSIKAADFRLFIRNNLTDASVAPFSALQLKLYWDGIIGSTSLNPNSPIQSIPALSDIWMEAEGSGAQTEVSIDFEILLVDDGF